MRGEINVCGLDCRTQNVKAIETEYDHAYTKRKKKRERERERKTERKKQVEQSSDNRCVLVIC